MLTCALRPGPALMVNLAPGPRDAFTLITAPVEVEAEVALHAGLRDCIRGWIRPRGGDLHTFLERYSRARAARITAPSFWATQRRRWRPWRALRREPMSSSIQYLPVDRALYTERLASFLPDDIVDVHTHVWRAGDIGADDSNKGRAVSWPSLVARDNPYEDLVETYRILMPGKRVTPIMFAGLPNDSTMDRLNAYVAECCARRPGAGAAVHASPLERGNADKRLRDGGFVGAKGYLTLAPDWYPGKRNSHFRFLSAAPACRSRSARFDRDAAYPP